MCEDERYTKKQKKPPPTCQNPRPVTTNIFFVSLRNLLIENVVVGSEGNSTETAVTNEGSD
jgi:hypothetical protein